MVKINKKWCYFHLKWCYLHLRWCYLLQEDRSGNSYEGSNGHIAKFARVNKLTGDVHEEKTSFRIVSQPLELLK